MEHRSLTVVMWLVVTLILPACGDPGLGEPAPFEEDATGRWPRLGERASFVGELGSEMIEDREPFQISLARYGEQMHLEVWTHSRRAAYAMVLILLYEHDLLPGHRFREHDLRVFGRAGTDPERWDFDAAATRVDGFVEQHAPGVVRLVIAAEFADGRRVWVSVELSAGRPPRSSCNVAT